MPCGARGVPLVGIEEKGGYLAALGAKAGKLLKCLRHNASRSLRLTGFTK